LGIFNLGPRGKTPYDAQDVELFSALIGLGSVFIENGRLYETLLKQNLKLSEVAHLKTQFVSNITHELRTPLHGILGLTDVLREDPERCLPEDYRRYLEMMKNAGESLMELVDHILDLTKYQSGIIQLKVKKFDLRKVIERAAGELGDQFKKQNCELVLNWPEDTPGVYGDETEVGHLVKDLLGNAVKFTRKGNVAVSPLKCGEMLKVCVRDSGIGIDEKDQQTIFEEFRQAEGEMTRSFGGSGLGLALAKRIVELHGGRIWVESKKGAGAHFYFTLPLTPSHVQIGLCRSERII
jgi:signal transduction histidine kinase